MLARGCPPPSRKHRSLSAGGTPIKTAAATACSALVLLAAATETGPLAGERSRAEAAGASGLATLSGEVLDAAGRPAKEVRVVAVPRDRALRFGAWTDRRGRFTIPGLPAGACSVMARADDGRVSAPITIASRSSAKLTLGASQASRPEHPSAWWLGALPDGIEKRRFILDCTGCHQFNETRVFAAGAPRSRAQWQADVERMLRYAGARSGFPVIGAGRNPERTAAWLAEALGADPAARAAAAAASVLALRGRNVPARPGAPRAAALSPAVILEVDMPVPNDLPHDVALEPDGRLLVTGMFSHVIQRFDTATLTLEAIELPVPRANPRAIEVDARGDWWVLFGQPRLVARRAGATGEWTTWPIAHYPHSIAADPTRAAVWFNGHFTRDPEVIGRLDPATGMVDSFVVPRHATLADSGGPVPYELRLAADGAVWMSELQGNRVVRIDREGRMRVFEMPEPWSGPRRLDLDAEGRVWIPAYSGGALWRLEPASGEFRRYALPIADAAPYVCRVNPANGEVWIGSGAADAVFRFDPGRERFRVYPLLTRGATIRHMAVDADRNEVWLALGASPAIHPARVVRLRPRD